MKRRGTRCAWTATVAFGVAFACFAVPASADTFAGIGAVIDYQYPLDSEMWGATMTDNAWGRDLVGIEHSVGADRNQFYTWNRPDRLIAPGLECHYGWSWGLSLHGDVRWLWLSWAPNQDVDIIMDRVDVPLLATAKWSFNNDGRWRPNVFAGGGVHYVSTRIFGKDLFDQARNPNFDSETLPEPDSDEAGNAPEPRRWLKESREFARSDWAPSAHAGIGLDVALRESLILAVAATYDVVPMDTIEAVLVRDDADEWHWVEKEISGDGGGIHGAVSIHYRY
ncbi:MAG: hypothetical protein IT350_18220 [Deltaproteobacteria bacterium]|nr:hypothetical protein [Deltaproteobacteria bacterium]